jgi:hypothetical protein
MGEGRKNAIRQKLAPLAQYKNNPEKLEEAVQKKYQKECLEKNWDIGLTKQEEKNFYFTALANYQKTGSVEQDSDKEMLKSLCYLELINYRIRKDLNELADSGGAVPTKQLECLNKNIEQIIKIKKDLGLTTEGDDTAHDVSKFITSLLRRYHKHINQPENKANYNCQCPHCLQYFLIGRRLDKEKEYIVPHPWFVKGGILFNEHLFKLLSDGKIDALDVSRVLGISEEEDYIQWLYKNYRIELFEKTTNQEQGEK